MTRKRFVKMMMAYRVQRNEAEQCANLVGLYGNYQDTYNQDEARAVRCVATASAASKAMAGAGMTVEIATASLVMLASQMAESLNIHKEDDGNEK